MKNQKATQPSKAAKPPHPNLLSILEGKAMTEATLRLAVRPGYSYNKNTGPRWCKVRSECLWLRGDNSLITSKGYQTIIPSSGLGTLITVR